MSQVWSLLILGLFGPTLVTAILLNTLLLQIFDILGLHTLWNWIQIRFRFNPPRRRGTASSLAGVVDRVDRVVRAFVEMGFSSDPGRRRVMILNGRFGLRIDHATAVNSKSGKPKYAMYVEGTRFEMGRFIGALAEPELFAMSRDYVDNVVFDFMNMPRHSVLGSIIGDTVFRLSTWMDRDVPDEISAEIFGLWAGSRHPALPGAARRRVLIRDLFTLNYGIDVILSFVYAQVQPILAILGIKIKEYMPPVHCNAFSLSRGLAGSYGDGSPEDPRPGHLFGRDFMFPTCDVFDQVACHVVYNFFPDDQGDQERLLSLNAPGMVGSVVALNEHAQIMGTDMVNGRNCRWYKLGVNSLMMVRWAMEGSRSWQDTVRRVAHTPRAVTWLYPFADGRQDRGGVIEAGRRESRPRNMLRYVPGWLKKSGLLPDNEYVQANPSGQWNQGALVRMDDWQYPQGYGDFNRGLFEDWRLPYHPERFTDPAGMLVDNPKAPGLPLAYYFAPLRVTRPGMFVVTNLFITPEMRLLAMNDWTVQVPAASNEYSDFQWRYDELNRTLCQALEEGSVSWEKAWQCINFLQPYDDRGHKTRNFFYYGIRQGRELPREEIQVGGSVSLADLHALVMKTRYGQYVDEPVTLEFGRILASLDG